VIATWVGAALVLRVSAAPPKEERVLAEAGVHAFYSPDGKWIAVSTKGGKFSLAEAHAPWGKKAVAGEYIHPAAFTADSKFLVLVDGKQKLHLASVATGKVETTVATKLKSENDLISSVALSGDGKHIAVKASSGAARVFDADGKNPVDLEQCSAPR